MDLQPVESSNVAAIGFDGSNIQVQFKSGKTYQYSGGEDVDMKALFEDFSNADSKGRFFAQQIKGRLTTKRVDTDDPNTF